MTQRPPASDSRRAISSWLSIIRRSPRPAILRRRRAIPPGSGASPWCAAASRSRLRSADESEATTGRYKPVRRRGDGAGRAASASGQTTPALAIGCRRPGSYPWAGRGADAHAGDAHVRLADLLGTAGNRQDHGCAAVGGCDRTAFRTAFGGVLLLWR